MGFQQGFRINTNTASLDTYRSYTASQAGLERNIERLSSGLRINRAADDAAGLSISNRMNNQVRGLQQANRNVQQGNNMLQTAEGGLNEISNILGRMRELAVQSASDTVNDDDRSSIDLEFDQLRDEITRISSATKYNNTSLIDGSRDKTATTSAAVDGSEGLVAADIFITSTAATGTTLTFTDDVDGKLTLSSDGSASGTQELDVTSGAANELHFDKLGVTLKLSATYANDALHDKTIVVGAGDELTLQIGANNTAAEDQLKLNLGSLSAVGLGISTSDLGGEGGANAQSAIDQLDAAIAKVNDERSNVGSLQNRLEFTSSNLMNSVQNSAASMSTIRDADFAAEAADLAKNQILIQSGTAMLAQANGLSQNVLSLIR